MHNNFRIVFLPLLLVLASCSNQQSRIQEINSLEQASTILDTAGKNALVIFDVDDTLTYPTDTIRQSDFWGQHSAEGREFYRKLDEHIKSSSNPDEVSGLIMSKIFLAEKPQAVELQTVSLVKKLQDRGIKVIALTNWPTREIGSIPSMAIWRFDKLVQVGINFSASFEQQEIVLNSRQAADGKHPMFYKGILLTDGVSKGSVLGMFLDAVHYKPDQIIFFDDQVKQIESVKNEANARGIPYHCFIYKAAEQLPRHYDPAIIDLQSEYLIKKHEYITEEQARELLKK